MDDPLFVRRFKRLSNLCRDFQRFLNWNRPTLDLVSQRVAFDQFQDKEVRTLVFFKPIVARQNISLRLH